VPQVDEGYVHDEVLRAKILLLLRLQLHEIGMVAQWIAINEIASSI
jgi:hypothetical protein